MDNHYIERAKKQRQRVQNKTILNKIGNKAHQLIPGQMKAISGK